jgi:hypothetical protein
VAIQCAPVTGAAVAEAGTFQMPAEANPAAVELEWRPGILAERLDGLAAVFELLLVGSVDAALVMMVRCASCGSCPPAAGGATEGTRPLAGAGVW